MFQKESYTIPSDNSGILLVKVIQTRRINYRKHTTIGSFGKISIKNTLPNLIKLKKKKRRFIVIRSSKNIVRKDNLSYIFIDNALVLLKKRMNTVGKELIGATSKELKIKKFRVAFIKIF